MLSLREIPSSLETVLDIFNGFFIIENFLDVNYA